MVQRGSAGLIPCLHSGREIWAHYEAGTLTPDVALTGRFERKQKAVDMDSVLREIEDTRMEEAARLLRMQG